MASEGSGQAGVRTTRRRDERGLGGAEPYLSSHNPPLRVTLPAVHCGAGEWLFCRAGPRETSLAPGGIKPRPRSLGSSRPIRFWGKDTPTRPLQGSWQRFPLVRQESAKSSGDRLCCLSHIRLISPACRLYLEAVCFLRGPTANTYRTSRGKSPL